MNDLTPEEKAELRQYLPWIKHADCTWEQVGPCVYCSDHDERLYNGSLPPAKGGKQPCEEGKHDWDCDTGLGWYFLCRTCGAKEWTE